MELIIRGRRNGKTAELIKRSAATRTYILTTTELRARNIFAQARNMGLDIPFPVTIDDYFSSHGFAGSYIKKVYMDDEDEVLRHIFNRVEIEAVTITDETERSGTDERGGTV